MNYLLDTCAVSDFVKGELNTLAHFKTVSPSNVFISSITVMEIHYGMMINPQRVTTIRQLMADFLVSVTIIPFGHEEAEEAASIRSLLKTQGTPIGSYDLLIAATAKTHNLSLVTSNLSEFQRVEGLTVENWRNK